ncbi:hypothetical protein BT69DRAFT_1279516 [Atractiella rhizophila]|nr:hypothetical protein BT69DRAFT_1279516 [Atractiella rhizophila]
MKATVVSSRIDDPLVEDNRRENDNHQSAPVSLFPLSFFSFPVNHSAPVATELYSSITCVFLPSVIRPHSAPNSFTVHAETEILVPFPR